MNKHSFLLDHTVVTIHTAYKAESGNPILLINSDVNELTGFPLELSDIDNDDELRSLLFDAIQHFFAINGFPCDQQSKSSMSIYEVNYCDGVYFFDLECDVDVSNLQEFDVILGVSISPVDVTSFLSIVQHFEQQDLVSLLTEMVTTQDVVNPQFVKSFLQRY